jgi:hypothetical protein
MFESAKLKIERANHHIDDLNAQVIAFRDSDFYRVYAEKDADGSRSSLKFRLTKRLDAEKLATIVGDAIHNTRSALDHTAYEIAVGAGVTGDDLRYIKFPFQETRQKLVDTLNGGFIQRAGTDIVQIIVETIRPYKSNGGSHLLCALHDLDITDKHELLIPVFSIHKIDGIFAESDRGMKINNLTFHLLDDWKGSMIGAPGELQIVNQGKPTVEIVFRKGQVFENKPVIPTLRQLTQLVAEIMSKFEEVYLARA